MLDSIFNFKIKPKVESINLGDEQIEALNRLEEFVHSKEDCICLSGSAGTGKTSICKELIDYLDDEQINYVVAAPTHRAKLVLEALTGCTDTYTVHQLLALSPNIEIFELDYRELVFEIDKAKGKYNSAIPYNGVVIVDEASMINDDLFDLLVEKCRKSKSKVIFVGDEKQLRPVKSNNLSKAFSLSNIIRLTKIYRQKSDSPVFNLLTELREHPLYSFETIKGKEDSITVYNNPTQFILAAKPYLEELVKTGNVLNCKILAYTNARVRGFNTAARKLLFEEDSQNEFNKEEILVGKDNFNYDDYQFYNSLDYVVKDEPINVNLRIPNFGESMNGFILNLYDTVYKTSSKVFVLSKKNNSIVKLSRLSNFIEETRLRAIELKQNRRRSADVWKIYYETINSFATTFDLFYNNRVIKKKTFDYGYASTVHCSQGLSINTVFVDIANINTVRDKEELQQLQYVAISRTRGNVYLLV